MKENQIIKEKNIKIKKSNYNLIKILAILTILMLIFNINFKILIYKINGSLLINFVDVGQGDCTLIRYNGKNILIDGGGSLDSNYNVGEKVLLPYLLNKKIKKIDYIIFSHFDNDHCQGLIYIMDKLKIENAIIGLQKEKYENYISFLEKAKKNKIKINITKKGDKIKIGKDLYFDVIWPDNNNLISENSINNNSLVIKLNYNNFSMLFTGDIEKIAEESILKIIENKSSKINSNINVNPKQNSNQKNKNKIINTNAAIKTIENSKIQNKNKSENIIMSSTYLNSTALKVAHHGSKTSTTQEFLDQVNPKIALIGVGKNNKFKHPSSDTIEKLNKKGCKIYRTDEMGEIFMVINSKGKIKINYYLK